MDTSTAKAINALSNSSGTMLITIASITLIITMVIVTYKLVSERNARKQNETIERLRQMHKEDQQQIVAIKQKYNDQYQKCTKTQIMVDNLERDVRSYQRELENCQHIIAKKIAEENSRERIKVWTIEQYIREYTRSLPKIERLVKRRLKVILEPLSNIGIMNEKDISNNIIEEVTVTYFMTDKWGQIPEPKKKDEYLQAVVDNAIYSSIRNVGALSGKLASIERKEDSQQFDNMAV